MVDPTASPLSSAKPVDTAADVASRSASEPVATSGRATAVMAAGSTAVAKSRSPSTWSSAARTRATSATPGTCSMSFATVPENGCPRGLLTT